MRPIDLVHASCRFPGWWGPWPHRQEHLGWTLGGLATAVVWGALHSGYPFEWVYTAAFGAGLQALVEHPSEHTEIITAAVVAHLVRNTLLSAYGIATRNWYLLEL